jgi:phosphohistidine phosphatase
MELILWRHADAEDGTPDIERKLTSRGRKQAEQVSKWLLARLPAKFLVLASPATRAQQTADALGVAFKTSSALAPGRSAGELIEATGWPRHKTPVIVVGHQPTLGRAVSRLVSGHEVEWSVKKAGLWWLAFRERHGEAEVVVRAVIAPELL